MFDFIIEKTNTSFDGTLLIQLNFWRWKYKRIKCFEIRKPYWAYSFRKRYGLNGPLFRIERRIPKKL